MRVRGIGGVLAVFLLLACGSQESKMERGVAVDEEVAAPSSAAEMKETEAERRAKEEREEDRESAKAFDEAEEAAGR